MVCRESTNEHKNKALLVPFACTGLFRFDLVHNRAAAGAIYAQRGDGPDARWCAASYADIRSVTDQ